MLALCIYATMRWVQNEESITSLDFIEIIARLMTIHIYRRRMQMWFTVRPRGACNYSFSGDIGV
jgi:hypothetical protein